MFNEEIAQNTPELPVVLLVEDNVDDVLLTRRAVKKAGLDVSLIVVNDGEKAVTYLERIRSSADKQTSPLPALILLDLRLPRKSGLEVLQWVRSHAFFARVPVIVLTSSTEGEDIKQAYERGANSYLEKPVAFDQLVETLSALGGYWFDINLTASQPAGNR
jgi:CheY-like chemotaxis protein